MNLTSTAFCVGCVAVSSVITYYLTRRLDSRAEGDSGSRTASGKSESVRLSVDKSGSSISDIANVVPSGFYEKYVSQRSRPPATLSGNAVSEEQGKQLPSPVQTATLIRQRRSIFPKDFGQYQVPIEIIVEILEAANWAPTHGKTEPWRFVVAGSETITKILDIRDEVMTDILKESGDDSGLQRHKKKMASKRVQLANCSAIIFIIRAKVPNGRGKFMPEWEETAAVACAVQNLHLQLTARWQDGVGGYWSSGGYDSWLQAPALKEMIGANSEDRCLGGFYLGYCDPAKMDRYRGKRGSLAEKVKWLW